MAVATRATATASVSWFGTREVGTRHLRDGGLGAIDLSHPSGTTLDTSLHGGHGALDQGRHSIRSTIVRLHVALSMR